MFKSLKFFVNQTIEIEDLLAEIFSFNYKRAKSVAEEGDFSQRGGIVDIFPTNFDCPLRIELEGNKIHSIHSIDLKSGKAIERHQIVIILPKKTAGGKTFSSETPLNSFVDIERGDYVVHNQHGIGRFLGIKEFSVDEKTLEHLVIEYEGGDRLFVPKHDLHLVQKYVGFTKKPPRLYRLGSSEWKSVRARVLRQIQKFAAELLRLQALRASLTGHRFLKDTDWQKEFENTFPFEETPDQIKSTKDVKSDMESGRPMDRLLCGDVGYGKTEVAMRAAFKCVMDNKQVAILVPTTILAEQHYYNFTQRLKNFPVRVAMLSRFRTRHEQQESLRGLAEGTVDIVIGTHRLLSGDIKFKDLGLLVIDEEQRFGVKAKEKLKHLRLLVDVLTLTATPIPRTLYMSLVGARDMSIINTPPHNRIPVSTHIVEFDEELIKDTIERELRRKGQVFFLHNCVENIDTIGNVIKRLSGQARVAIAHGQMPARLLEEIMLQFLQNRIDVLVCTTIIESGIDIPNANTLIVNRADRFGLADLHQLRGRVGRFNTKAYAYFIVPPRQTLSSQAKNRLKALEQFSALGSGFNIAFEDLQIRGAGNLLGPQQHGHISAVGFDLYCRLLKECVENLRKETENNVYHQPKNEN
ncbi:MAG TPA: transcription-repair coupling factor [Candidatus Omnitrophota bacterium]|nr:transcription-repair coupling factor [Candidatus Omnitrophota bacterium]HPD85290.1 transcription-repair coupling factor [Candidatus Omnitrophota bacterium]HRZ04209.1 transcription-repair coupling factor [Candidatus Omnitrophota bacterium]